MFLLSQVEQLRRTNKIWANDNIHLFRILKIPVKKDSTHYLEELEVSEDESGTEDNFRSCRRVNRFAFCH